MESDERIDIKELENLLTYSKQEVLQGKSGQVKDMLDAFGRIMVSNAKIINKQYESQKLIMEEEDGRRK